MPAFRMRVGFVVKPLMKGSWYSLVMSFRSAPSAKIFTVNRSIDSIENSFRPIEPNPVGCVGKRLDDGVRRLGVRFQVRPVDEDRRASCAASRFDVPPPVADHEARFKTESVVAGCRPQQSVLRLPTVALIAVVMVADPNVVERQQGRQSALYRVNDCAVLSTPGNVRLIGHDDESKPGAV